MLVVVRAGEKPKHMFKGWRRFRAKKSKTKTPVPTALPPSSEDLLASLLEKTPGAVRAQREMDAHPHGFHNNKNRLYELIDFNDTFVALALSLDPANRKGFIERLRVSMQQYCKKQGFPMFTDEQYDAITRGLSREVAVYLGAMGQGFQVEMTSRTQDAMGVDMVITDPVSGRYVNIDCKTPSAYHFRVKDLVQQGRLSEQKAILAEQEGYVHERNGQGSDAISVVILRIDPNELGDIVDFSFKTPALLRTKLLSILETV